MKPIRILLMADSHLGFDLPTRPRVERRRRGHDFLANHRKGIRDGFLGILEETGWREEGADLRFLCLHHCVEGARVGPRDFTFRNAPDVIRGGDLPQGFAAILSGHIHRHQRLDRDLRGRQLPGPVVYPGSVERTAFAEVGEEKGFLVLEAQGGPNGRALLNQSFVDLSPRPMAVIHLDPREGAGGRWSPGSLGLCLRERLMGVPPDSVLQVRIRGHLPPGEREALSAANLRRVLPGEMNIQIILRSSVALGRGRP